MAMKNRSKKQDFTILAAGAAGGVAVGLVAKQVIPLLGLPDSITPYVPAVLGVGLSIMAKDPMFKAAGIGMIGAAAPGILTALGIDLGDPMLGLNSQPYDYTRSNNVQLISGPMTPEVSSTSPALIGKPSLMM
jgi:hypothetical protein